MNTILLGFLFLLFGCVLVFGVMCHRAPQGCETDEYGYRSCARCGDCGRDGARGR